MSRTRISVVIDADDLANPTMPPAVSRGGRAAITLTTPLAPVSIGLFVSAADARRIALAWHDLALALDAAEVAA
jgi:hypothetical protein